MDASTHDAARGSLPLLRHRSPDANEYDEYDAPASIVGHVTALDEDYVRISQGPSLETELHPLDLVRAFGDDDDIEAAYALLLDAAVNKDLVKIKLGTSHITYENDAQTKRYAALA